MKCSGERDEAARVFREALAELTAPINGVAKLANLRVECDHVGKGDERAFLVNGTRRIVQGLRIRIGRLEHAPGTHQRFCCGDRLLGQLCHLHSRFLATAALEFA